MRAELPLARTSVTIMLTADPLTVTLGSELRGIDLNVLDDRVADQLYELVLERGVLVFRDQALKPEAHVALAESFGPRTELHPLYPHVEGLPIARIRTDAAHPPENEVWHSDLSCRPDPPFVSVLRAEFLPPVGGDTLWADLRAVHDALSDERRVELNSLFAEHALEQGFRFVDAFGQNDRADALAEANRIDRAKTVAVHPVLKRHPATGRFVVYVNESFTTHICDIDPARSSSLLSELYSCVRNPRFQVRVRWRPGTVIIWDNWATQHFASGDYYPHHEREVQRVTIASDRRSSSFSTNSTA